jgi:hypothetical protein
MGDEEIIAVISNCFAIRWVLVIGGLRIALKLSWRAVKFLRF